MPALLKVAPIKGAGVTLAGGRTCLLSQALEKPDVADKGVVKAWGLRSCLKLSQGDCRQLSVLGQPHRDCELGCSSGAPVASLRRIRTTMCILLTSLFGAGLGSQTAQWQKSCRIAEIEEATG